MGAEQPTEEPAVALAGTNRCCGRVQHVLGEPDGRAPERTRALPFDHRSTVD